AASGEEKLHVFFQVTDPDVVYHNPSVSWLGSGDRLVVVTEAGDQLREHTLPTSAPGLIQSRYSTDSKTVFYEPRIQIFWQDTEQGYNIELQAPLSLLDGKFGFYFIDQRGVATSDAVNITGNFDPLLDEKLPRLIFPNLQLSEVLESFQLASSLHVVDEQFFVIGGPAVNLHHQSLAEGRIDYSNSDPANKNWFLRFFYRLVLADENLPTAAVVGAHGKLVRRELEEALRSSIASSTSITGWYAHPVRTREALLVSASPIFHDEKIIGAVLVEQDSAEFLSLTDRAFSNLLYYSMLAILVCVTGLLGYATLLSVRIRRLSTAVQQVIRPDGALQNDFPASTANDEIGDLSRNYAELLGRLTGYTEYLRNLSGKLAHELRTPIAIVQSSLENLDQNDVQESQRIYIRRARDGLDRLRHILTAMAEANHLADSIDGNERIRFNISDLVASMADAYRELHTVHHFSVTVPSESVWMDGAPDLIAQLLDKLLDNAVDFTPPGALISIGLGHRNGAIELSIANQGPLLPEGLHSQIFDSMVSLRSNRDDQAHLGIGLYVVKLIADFHRARLTAVNLSDGSGVEFAVHFPLKYR
ncbi:MAG: two-component system sensor histidine kinase ChvG, partial [Halieaceae bacterium]